MFVKDVFFSIRMNGHLGIFYFLGVKRHKLIRLRIILKACFDMKQEITKNTNIVFLWDQPVFISATYS